MPATMLNQATHYCAALLLLIACAIAYDKTTGWWLEPPPIQSVSLAKAKALRPDASLSDLFDADAWQLGKCKRIRTADAVLLFADFQRGEGDMVTLSPVTVVYGRGMLSNASERPLILEAQKAEIEFAQSVNLLSSDVSSDDAPPIKRGNLIGDVRIRRTMADQASSAAADAHTDAIGDDDLDIQTSYISIDNRRIWTTQRLAMRIGQATLIGRDLTLHLSAAAGGGRGGAASALEKMELIYLDELTYPIAADPLRGRPGGRWDVRCGSVDYDFAVHELGLRDSVSITRVLDGVDQPDRFDCANLRLTLRDPLNKSLPRNEPIDWIESIVAIGSEAAATRLQVPSMALQMVAPRIEFLATQRRLEAGGDVSGAAGTRPAGRGAGPAPRPPVTVLYQGMTAGLSHVVVDFQTDTQTPRRLATLASIGPGGMLWSDDTSPLRQFAWNDRVVIELSADPDVSPAPTRGNGIPFTVADIDTIHAQVDGGVAATLVDGGSFQSAGVWCELKSNGDPNVVKDSSPFSIRRFQAIGDVVLDTPSIRAATSTLQLFFDNVPRSGGPVSSWLSGGVAGSRAAASGTAAASQDRGGRKSWLTQPPPDAVPVAPVARSRPTISGKSIIASLSLAAGEVYVDDLSVNGDVNLRHLVQVGTQSLEATMHGEQLRLINQAGDDLLYLKSGVDRPARFDLGDGYFVGPTIEIRPSESLIEIREAGEFLVPTAVLPLGLAGAESPSSMVWVRPPLCHWRGGMSFDGRRVLLGGGVQIDAEVLRQNVPYDVSMRGDTMELTLNRQVALRDIASLRQATVDRLTLVCDDGRPVETNVVSRAVDGSLLSRHVLHVSRLVYDPADGGLLAGDGPGAYWAWIPGTMDQAIADAGDRGGDPRPGDSIIRSTREAARLANRSPPPVAGPAPISIDGNLTGVHLVFYQQMIASVLRQTLQFQRGVKIAARPAAGWDDAVDAFAMQSLDEGELTLDCDRLTLGIDPAAAGTASAWPPAGPVSRPSSAWEMLADGGVMFRTNREEMLYEVAASTASYHSSKDIFSLRGAPNRAAVLRRTLPGQPQPEAVLNSLTLGNLRTGPLKIDMDVRSIKFGQVPAAATPQVR